VGADQPKKQLALAWRCPPLVYNECAQARRLRGALVGLAILLQQCGGVVDYLVQHQVRSWVVGDPGWQARLGEGAVVEFDPLGQDAVRARPWASGVRIARVRARTSAGVRSLRRLWPRVGMMCLLTVARLVAHVAGRTWFWVNGRARTCLWRDGGRSGSAAGLLGPGVSLAAMQLPPGVHEAQFGGIDPTGTARVSVAWRNAWRGL
jgi:hypothetical protein